MAVIAAPDFSDTQKRVMRFSALSLLGLVAAGLLAVVIVVAGGIVLGVTENNTETQKRATSATMAITAALWLPFHIWCRGQVRCASCGRSLFQTLWSADYDFIGGKWQTTVRANCPRCGVRQP